jgi:hypothetical protein
MSEKERVMKLGICERYGCNKRAVVLIKTQRDGLVAVCKEHQPRKP